MKYGVDGKVRVVRGVGQFNGYSGRVLTVNALSTAPYPYGVKIHVNGKAKTLNMAEDEIELIEPSKADGEQSAVDHPGHYTWLPNGLEVIDLTEHLNFCRGNAVKYLARAGRKGHGTELEDLKKARWYIDREIQRTEKEQGK
ncbi:DUF3310 domain-containing protein [Streptomyces sp. 21So2-11]|uniref:DUF3310 domain-containing protein n=1 Tax=Streptomyces sp. 21So2-11 TaxID=3144408 RepID=UPI00321B89B3